MKNVAQSSQDPSSRADRSGLESCQHGYREKTKAKKYNNMYDKQEKGKDIKLILMSSLMFENVLILLFFHPFQSFSLTVTFHILC